MVFDSVKDKSRSVYNWNQILLFIAN